jgi:CheY-like chemotaxis protein
VRYRSASAKLCASLAGVQSRHHQRAVVARGPDHARPITDINMPNMDGMELIKQLRALPGFRFTPILTLTPESHGTGRDEAKKLGATGWIVKSVRGPDLIKIIKQGLPDA